MTTRAMTGDEVSDYLGPEEYHRGIVVQEGARVVGWVGWNRLGGAFYAYSLFCEPEYPYAWAALMQALRRNCRKAGRGAITFAVDVENRPFLEAMMRMKRVRVASYLLEMEV